MIDGKTKNSSSNISINNLKLEELEKENKKLK
jgi:hypothetical protein